MMLGGHRGQGGGQQGGNNGGGFVMPPMIGPIIPIGIGPTRPPHLNPGPSQYLQGLIANFKARLTAATQRFAHESVLFLAAIMQLWGDNLTTPIVPVNNLTTELDRCNWLCDRFIGNGAKWQINIDDQVAAPLRARRQNNTLDIEAFNAAFEAVYTLATQANL